jgi:hypothetical protein
LPKLKIIKRDIALMYILAKFVSKYPMSKKVRPTEIVAEFEGIILNELNMLREAKNATQLRENFQGSDLLYVPKVHWDLCSLSHDFIGISTVLSCDFNGIFAVYSISLIWYLPIKF